MAGTVVGGAASANKPQLYELRMASGRVVTSLQPADVSGFTPTDTAAVYLYRRPDAAAPLQVVADGKRVGTLGPDQYLTLSWRDRRRDLKVCLQDPKGDVCYTFVPIFNTATYIQYGHLSAVYSWCYTCHSARSHQGRGVSYQAHEAAGQAIAASTPARCGGPRTAF
jgi:hypothetical protein